MATEPTHQATGILNTLQLYCGKSAEAVAQLAPLEKAGYEIETVPAMSNKHVFHLTGRCNRSIASVLTADANPYDIFALLTETEIGNPFLVWEPEKVKGILDELGVLRKKHHLTGGKLDSGEQAEFERLEAELKKQRKPIIFYGTDEAWKGIMDFLDHLNANGLARAGFTKSITRCRTPEEVIKEVSSRTPKDLSGMSLADYKFHTYEPGAAPVTEIIAEKDPRKRSCITVAFFGSATTRQESHLQTASRSVEMCHRHGWGMVNGGGVYGVMGRQLDDAKKRDVYLHGISAHERGGVGLSAAETDPEIIKQKMAHYSACKDMIHRIEYYLEQSEAIGVLDGGLGSSEELFMVLELFRQQHKATLYQDTKGVWHSKPFVVIDENGTWEPLIKLAKEKYGAGYVAPLQLVHSMKEAEAIYVKQFEKYLPKLPAEVVARTTHSVWAELKGAIPDLLPLAEKVTHGRPEKVKDWQAMTSLVNLTNLDDKAAPRDIMALCNVARLQHAPSVHVRRNQVERAKAKLAGSDIKVITVTNFPAGDLAVEKAVKEMQDASAKGADEITTVFPLRLLKNGHYAESHAYLKRVIGSVTVPVRVILETAELTPEQIAQASIIARSAGAKCVVTSTERSSKGGADVEAVEIMRSSVGNDVRVEANGSIDDFEQAMAMVEAGADTIGTRGLSITAQQQRVPSARINGPHHESLPGYALREDKTVIGR